MFAQEIVMNSASVRKRGIALIWVALTGLLLIGFTGLALDTAYGMRTLQQLQDAADAAALAGVLKVREGIEPANRAAIDVAMSNTAARNPVQLRENLTNAIDGDIEVGRYNRQDKTFTNIAIAEFNVPNAVKVVARRTDNSEGGPLDILFGPIFGVDTINVSRPAIAIVTGTTGGGLITLCDECECSLHFSGNIIIDVTNAEGYDGQSAIQVNSDDDDAMCCDGNAMLVDAPETNIVGDADSKCYSANGLNTYIEPDSPPINDPLAGLDEPPCDTMPTRTQSTDETVWNEPGYYPGGIEMTASGQVANFNPGIYCLDGAGLNVTGGTLNAQGVMFYVMDSTPGVDPESHVYLGGNAVATITPIDNPDDEYWGVSIFQARDNTNESTIIGTSDMDLKGTLYFPEAPLNLAGTGFSVGNQLIAWTLLINGTGTFTVAYDGRFPAAGKRVFLVE
jgi:hypothetical protein